MRLDVESLVHVYGKRGEEEGKGGKEEETGDNVDPQVAGHDPWNCTIAELTFVDGKKVSLTYD